MSQRLGRLIVCRQESNGLEKNFLIFPVPSESHVPHKSIISRENCALAFPFITKAVFIWRRWNMWSNQSNHDLLTLSITSVNVRANSTLLALTRIWLRHSLSWCLTLLSVGDPKHILRVLFCLRCWCKLSTQRQNLCFNCLKGRKRSHFL